MVAQPNAIRFQWTPLPVIDRLFIRAFARSRQLSGAVRDSSPFNNNPSARVQRLGAITIMKLFDRLIVHTEQAQRRLLEYGVDPARLALIPHGVLGQARPKRRSLPRRSSKNAGRSPCCSSASSNPIRERIS